QTLRALVDWSHDLLTQNERALLRRLSLFVGGWTLDAAEAVCEGGPVAAHEVLELLVGLVDKSLVVIDGDTAERRYRLHETIRQYAQEKLREAVDESSLEQRHFDWYSAFAEQAQHELY